MLYNQDWDNKKDIHSLESLISWLREQDPAKKYKYWEGDCCCLAQYYDAMGEETATVDQAYLYTDTGMRPLPDGFNTIARGRWFTNTFGHALNRALKFQKESGECPMLASLSV